VLTATVAAAQAQETGSPPTSTQPPRRDPGAGGPVLFVAAHYSGLTQFSGGLGCVVPVGDQSGPYHIDVAHARHGLEILGTCGTGGVQIAVGPAILLPEEWFLTYLFDVRATFTRTSSEAASPNATFVGVESGLPIIGAMRLGLGVAYRVTDQPDPDRWKFTASFGLLLPVRW